MATKIQTGRNGPPSSLGVHEFLKDTNTSALTKYQDLTVGDRNLWHLFKYETLTLLLTNLPGLLGFSLRQKLYRSLFKRFDKRVVIGSGVSLRQPGKISIERSCIIDDLVSLHVRGTETAAIQLAENVFIGRGTSLNVREGRIEIDKYTSISSNCRIASMRSTLRIGSYVQIAAYCYIGGGNHKADQTDIPMALQGSENRIGVTIEDDVWIGAHTVVMDGVRIGKGSIIGACSFVNKDIPEHSIAFGCPASVHKKRT